MRYITIRFQKNKKITIGTTIHRIPNCERIRPEAAKMVTGEILRVLPKCKYCFKKD